MKSASPRRRPVLPAITLAALVILPTLSHSQVVDPAPPPQSNAPSSSSSRSGSSPQEKSRSTFLGKDVPSFDPGTEILTWDGKNWNVNNNRIFQGRFEKYLNAPPETSTEDQQYRKVIAAILDKLAPGSVSTKNVDEAFRLLPQASNFDIDARLCDALADAVYSAWRSQDAGARLEQANVSLEEERKRNEWNAMMSADSGSMNSGSTKDKAIAAQKAKEIQLQRDMRMLPYTTRLAEVMALIKANQVKKAASELQSKIEFQALIVQFFLQRRFQHVLMATRFYRSVFDGGDTKLQVGKDAKDLFARSLGMPPTVGTLDALANEAMRDVRESVSAFDYLLQQGELESATKRLAEAFTIGEYLPEIRTIPRENKRRALEFTQASNQLISAIDVKDYTLAETLVKSLQEMAKDFDASKPLAAIETSKMVSGMHIAKAKNAAVSGDKDTLEAELRAATEIWPRNPALAEVSGLIFSQADVQQRALVDLDQLISQKNYRQIFDDKVRFIAATALYPDRQEQLRKVLDAMQTVEVAIFQSAEIAKRGDNAGAWEGIERAFQQYPEDSKLNQERANYTTQAADFVRTLKRAEMLEGKNQFGSSLAWYLKAQEIYPASQFAQEGIARLVAKILPDAT